MGHAVKGPHVVVGLLSHNGNFCSGMLQSLDHMVKKSIESGIKVNIAKTYGSIIPANRNKIVDSLLECGADYLLFIDSDMVFDDDALIQLMNHKRDIVSGLAVSRIAPFNPVAKDLQENGRYVVRKGLHEGRFYSDLDMVGCAFMLIKADVFKKLKKPYFAMPAYKESVMGEDVYFCRAAKEAGYDVCVDSSLLVGHIGEHIYTIHDHINFMETMEEEG